jgi:small subunit ribosomal protein S11e
LLQTGLFYQKQKPIFIGKKRLLGLKLKKQEIRYVRQVGLGIKTPKSALEGTFVDNKCPFTGNVSIRGRIPFYLPISICIIVDST